MEGIGDTEVNTIQFPASKILQCNLQSATVGTPTQEEGFLTQSGIRWTSFKNNIRKDQTAR